MVADLDAFPTRDRVLRRGRRAWRRKVRSFERYSSPPVDDPCRALERGEQARWAEDAAPITRRQARRIRRRYREDTGGSSLARTEHRLKVLGVRDRRAEHIGGSALWPALQDTLDDVGVDILVIETGDQP